MKKFLTMFVVMMFSLFLSGCDSSEASSSPSLLSKVFGPSLKCSTEETKNFIQENTLNDLARFSSNATKQGLLEDPHFGYLGSETKMINTIKKADDGRSVLCEAVIHVKFAKQHGYNMLLDYQKEFWEYAMSPDGKTLYYEVFLDDDGKQHIRI